MVPVIVTDGAELKDIVTFEELEEFALLMFKYIREKSKTDYHLMDTDSVVEKLIENIGDKDVTININTDMDFGCWDDEPEGITIDGGQPGDTVTRIFEGGGFADVTGTVYDGGIIDNIT